MIDATIIEAMRRDKHSGLSLLQLSLKYKVAKSTASLYCRDLYNNPQRIYKTGKDARQRIVANRKRYPCIKCGTLCKREGGLCAKCFGNAHTNAPHSNHDHHKKYPCKSCKVNMVYKLDGVCLSCYRTIIHKKALIKQQEQDARQHDKQIRMESRYAKDKERLLASTTPCQLSPTKAHYWIINSDNIGVCKYCNMSKPMPVVILGNY